MYRKIENKIISVAGLKESGKSLAADMLGYLLNAPKIFQTYTWYKIFRGKHINKNWEVTSFARPLKKCLSAILNVPIDWFEDRDNKENVYVSLNTLRLYPKYKLHPDIILSENKFQKLIKSGEVLPADYVLSVRQLMQYFGTEGVRHFLGDKTWINSTLNEANSKNIIVSDLRFKVELEEIKARNGRCIYIKRDTAVPGSHASEKEVLELLEENKFDNIIDNNGTLEDLFNNLKKIV